MFCPFCGSKIGIVINIDTAESGESIEEGTSKYLERFVLCKCTASLLVRWGFTENTTSISIKCVAEDSLILGI